MSQPRSPQPASPPSGDRSLGYVLAGLVLSGAAGLIDEVSWIRRSSLIFGSTTHALSTVLTVFFLGLAIGGSIFGRLAQRLRRPLRTCALVEVALALLVLATPLAFDAVEGIYGRIYRALPPDSTMLWGARVGLIGLILLPPTILMGGTLPLFGRQFVRDPNRIGSSIAWLYGLNTLGAAAGCLLAGFVLLPALGIRGSLGLAAGLNLIAAALMAAARGAVVEPVALHSAKAAVRVGVRRMVALLLFTTGFVALGEEVLWARFLAPLVGGTVRTYTLTLTLVLVGIVLGSVLVAQLSDRARSRVFLFGMLQIASGLLVWWLMLLPPAWWRSLGGEIPTAAVLLLPPAVLAGASFPLAVRMVVSTPAWAGFGLGTMTAVNTLGGIAGALAVGFFVLPHLGLEAGVRICTALSLAAGFAAWIGLERSAWRTPRMAFAAAAIAAWFAVPAVTKTRIPADFLAERSRLVAWREGYESNLAVVRRSAGGVALEIDRWWQGQDRRTHQAMAAHLPMLLHPQPRRALLVGVGAGQTPMRLALYDLERLDCVDIEPRVFDLVRDHFPHAWMSDSRVRLLPMDGRNHLMHTGDRYDLISLEVGQLFRPGAASFYTLEFYRRTRARLAPGGLLSQFVPLPFLSAAELRGVIATFLEVFPQATLWYNTSELLLIGSADGPVRLTRERMARVMADSTIAADLEFSLWGGQEHWLSRPEVQCGAFLCGPTGLAVLSKGGAIYRDDPALLEYAVARPHEGDRREIGTLPLVQGNLEPASVVAPWITVELAGAASAVREENLREVIAAAYLRGVEPARERNDIAGAVGLLQQALAAQPGNAMANQLMGDALLLQNRAEESERFYRRALTISDRDARAHAGLALLCLVGERLPEGIEQYRAALALEGDNADWRNNLGAALARTGDFAGALGEFERAVALRPDFADARRNVEQARAVLAAGQRAPGG